MEKSEVSILTTLFKENREGQHKGIYSICSAHPFVIEAAFEVAKDAGTPLLIEATCNQVNHLGGYTGMQPIDFYKYVTSLAKKTNFPAEKLILGGDHLGPNPWRHLSASEAMQEAEKMVSAYVEAGFTKIHLDASMACKGDQEPLTDEIIASRAAQLCQVAERAAAKVGTKPVYIIGTEVPVPGGEVANGNLSPNLSDRIVVTRPKAVLKTLKAHHDAFQKDSFSADAWQRAVGVVTQPGVDFDDKQVLDYDPSKAKELSESILSVSNFVFEAHSTDYQTQNGLFQLVRDHFAILKVGPELTFALREALFALSYIEDTLYSLEERSQLRDVVERVMINDPQYWQAYYTGSEEDQKLARQFSYSDRVRYYLLHPEVNHAIDKLFKNMEKNVPAETLVSQWLPEIYHARRQHKLDNNPRNWVKYKIKQVITKYSDACFQSI